MGLSALKFTKDSKECDNADGCAYDIYSDIRQKYRELLLSIGVGRGGARGARPPQ